MVYNVNILIVIYGWYDSRPRAARQVRQEAARRRRSVRRRRRRGTVSVGPKRRVAVSRNVHSFTTSRRSTAAASLQHPIDLALLAREPGGHKPARKPRDKPGHRVVRQLALPLYLAIRRGAGSSHSRGQLWEDIELQLPGGRRRWYTRGRNLYPDQVWSRV